MASDPRLVSQQARVSHPPRPNALKSKLLADSTGIGKRVGNRHNYLRFVSGFDRQQKSISRLRVVWRLFRDRTYCRLVATATVVEKGDVRFSAQSSQCPSADVSFAVTSANRYRVGRLMWATSSSPDWGKRLRAERERLRLTLRDVETLSRTIAKDRQNADYYIAHASLADIENGKLAPTIFKLYSLSVIYGLDYDRLAILSGVPVPEAAKDHMALALPRTYLLEEPP